MIIADPLNQEPIHPTDPGYSEWKAINRLRAKREQAISYLRAQGIYRGDINCRHRYTPHQPGEVCDNTVTVTVCSYPRATVNHAVRG